MSIPKPGDPFALKAEIDSVTGTTDAYDVIDVVSRSPHLRHGDILVGLVTITPEMAKDWRTRYNVRNRNIVKTAVAGHARDMAAGDWLFIGDTIRFAVGPDGKPYLADGQHRLGGVEASGEAQTYIVVTGLHDDAQTVIDTGRVRTFANTLSLERVEEGGEAWSDVNRLGAIVRRVFLFDVLGKMPTSGGSRTPTKPELRNFLSTHAARFRTALTVCQQANNAVPKVGKSATMIGAAYFVLARKDEEAADIFFREMLIKGFGLDDEHPVTHLRRRYAQDGPYAIGDDEAFMLTLKAWNHWRKNDKLQRTLPGHKTGWPSDVREYPIF